ncbi:MAG TPA: YncE family protein, partial [Blastocatellia bacterium]|nr:YncE family protein [Blastocatellia bacterium]
MPKLNRRLAVILLLISSAVIVSGSLKKTVGATDKTAATTLFGRPLTPAGSLVMDRTTRQPAVGAMPVNFVRSPDKTGPEGLGRYLVAVNSGFGIQFNALTKPNQSLAVIDLNAQPVPEVIQDVYFPAPESANIGAAFATEPDNTGPDKGSYKLYVSGGFENRIWIFHLSPGADAPLSPASPGPYTKVEGPSIDVAGFSTNAPSPNYNDNQAPVYPAGLAISPDGDSLFVANNLADNLGIIAGLDGPLKLERVDLHRSNRQENVYPYGVAVLPSRDGKHVDKVFVSCWNTATVAVVDPNRLEKVIHIPVGGHPTAMLLNESGTRLYVVNSGADSVSAIDTASNREVERISVKLSEKESFIGNSPEALALGAGGSSLYVANAHSDSVAVVELSAAAQGARSDQPAAQDPGDPVEHSRVAGFIPTGLYPSSLAVVGKTIFIGNGKGTGFENSSLIVSNNGTTPNVPNDRFPAGKGQGGEYIVSLMAGNISAVDAPGEADLRRYTGQVMVNNGLAKPVATRLFADGSPIKHVIYVIKENRSYDQVFGDLAQAGDGQAA